MTLQVRWREGQAIRVAVLARSVYPLHRYGGLEQHVYDLVRTLLARDVRITLIAPPADAHLPADARADAVFRHPNLTLAPVPYTTFPFANRRGTTILDRSTAYPLFGLRAGRAAARLANAGEIDIVHGLGASVLGYAIGDRATPLVFNPQGLEEFGATDPSRAPVKRAAYLPLRIAVRRCAKAADRIIATDRALLSPVITHLRVRSDIVRVIPNAIEVAECDRPETPAHAQALREQIGLHPDDLLFVSVSRLEANKGYRVLIRALAELVRERALPERWRWILVGEGPLRRELEEQISLAGLTGRAILRGRVDGAEVHAWHEAATLFVHPTLYEGSSIVTLEAMAHRRPIIATRAGGLPDKVIPSVNGWLVPPGDAGALAAAIREATLDRARLPRMGAASRELVEREFSWSGAADRTVALYKELLSATRSL
ncbi:MAG TPA: glycosyltransferase family 4 protein [Vicinamibacterales bacterium]|nr:glycosyltransferase family 4 protein [Vicinamibacterales bacterium]